MYTYVVTNYVYVSLVPRLFIARMARAYRGHAAAANFAYSYSPGFLGKKNNSSNGAVPDPSSEGLAARLGFCYITCAEFFEATPTFKQNLA